VHVSVHDHDHVHIHKGPGGRFTRMTMTPPWKARLDALKLRDLSDLFGTPKPILGMVHCWPLPGAPGYTGYGVAPPAREHRRPRGRGARGPARRVSGKMTGDAPDLEKVHKAKELAGDCPLLIGSGADEDNVHSFLSVADGVIVGTSVKEGGVCENPVDPERVRRLVNAARSGV
jgi:BtpA family